MGSSSIPESGTLAPGSGTSVPESAAMPNLVARTNWEFAPFLLACYVMTGTSAGDSNTLWSLKCVFCCIVRDLLGRTISKGSKLDSVSPDGPIIGQGILRYFPACRQNY